MRVLIVEDNEAQARCVAEVVRISGHELVGVAASEGEALNSLDQALPDVALVDVELNGRRDGIQLMESLWALWRIPSVMTSGHDVSLRETEAIGSLPKPASAAQIAAVLDYLQARSRGESNIRAPRSLRLAPAAARRLKIVEAGL